MSVIHILAAELELTSPAAVAAPEAHTVGSILRPGLPLARDGWGNPYIPGSSLAGSLRHQAPQERQEALFGDVRKDPEESAAGGTSETTVTASAVRVLGTRITSPRAPLSRRRRTAVDRHRAAARANTLHERELLPPGTELTLWLRIDTAQRESPLLDEVIGLLSTWRPRIGGGRTTGYGRAELIRVRHRVIDLATTDGLRHWLTCGGPELVDKHATTVYHRAQVRGGAPDEPHLFGRPLEFAIADALHVGSGTVSDRSARRTGVARILRDHEDTPVVPGSSWKGVLRGRVELILRSVGIGDVCASVADEQSGGCGACDICVAFGWTEQSGVSADDVTAETVGARGKLLFADSPVREGTVRVRNHVAIDRVFGGARDEALFSEETVENGQLTLHLRHDGEVPALVRAALVLALGDLADGSAGIGGGTTRGYGTLTAEPATAEWLATERAQAVETLRAHRAEAGSASIPSPAKATEEVSA
ncbi:RAMP superfamily CRISPR-associated protein [Streptomyces albogriseolus]|uniref:RAMP superfamily CRISPR-associated protein n=1 Tax=Streptomyces albogriseolus TaxID=1887 RepID=UPI00384F8197